MSPLLDKMRAAVRARSINRLEGIETRLDLMALDHDEFMIYLRKCSMLQAKIIYRVDTRNAEEALKALIAMTKKGYCPTCYEVYDSKRECKCSRTFPW